MFDIEDENDADDGNHSVSDLPCSKYHKSVDLASSQA
jgi:hypothetical protein